MSNFWKISKKPITGLAPMDGVTDAPMRQAQTQVAKPDVTYTEFISVEGFIRKPEAFIKTLQYSENERPVVVQLFGHTPEDFGIATEMISCLGFDGIDLNMGCPARKVIHSGGGGALIGNYKVAEKIIRETQTAIEKQKVNLPLSVKTRIGIKEIITNDWFTFLSQQPVDEVTIHGRLVTSGVSGPVNWDEIGKANKILKNRGLIVLGNGGIQSVNEGYCLCQKYSLDGFLVGQAACGNPWIFKDNYEPTLRERFNIMLNHAKLIETFYEGHRYPTTLKHFSWYCRGFDNAKELRKALVNTKNLKEAENIIMNFPVEKYSV